MSTGKPRFRPIGGGRTRAGMAALALAAALSGTARAGSESPSSPIPSTPTSKMPPIVVSLVRLASDPAGRVTSDRAVPEGGGSIAAAVLGSASYDVAAIDRATLGLAGAPINKERTVLADVDGDGRLD